MNEIEDVKKRLDIVDVISDNINLRKTGQNFIGFCPFHANTKTPAFVVFPETQSWRCFGACADGGDIFNYVMKHEGCEFKEALELLAQRANVSLNKRELTPQAKTQNKEREKLLQLNEAAAAYFHQLLTKSPAGETTRQYLEQRELTLETVVTFQLGYALDKWDALKNHFLQRGYTTTNLVDAGLIIERDNGSTYDRFRNRLIIPIRNPKGQVIGFGARGLTTDQRPKYLNSPQTTLFDKSATLYGLDLARKQIRRTNEAVIVEGYMDVIQAYQQGARNVVAQMGTALTEEQLKQVATKAHKIVLALDSDTAGNMATLRSLSLARQALPKTHQPRLTSGGRVRFEGHIEEELYIAELPLGQDPDDILRQGLQLWEALIAQAKPALDFYEQMVFRHADPTTPEGKSFIVRELLPVYREEQDAVAKTARVQQLARKIGLDERLLLEELKRSDSATSSSSTRAKKEPTPSFKQKQTPAPNEIVSPLVGQQQNYRERQEAYCLAIMIVQPTSLALVNHALEAHNLASLSITDFTSIEHRELFELLQLWTASENPRLEILVEMVGDVFPQKLQQLISRSERFAEELPKQLYKGLSETILRLRIGNLKQQTMEIEILQSEATEEGDSQSIRQYLLINTECFQQRAKLERAVPHVAKFFTTTGGF